MAKIIWGLVIVLVIGLGIAIYAERRPEIPLEEAARAELEVRFEGRTLQKWKRELDSPSIERRIAAVRAAREFGIVGMPLFFKALGDDDHFIREMAEKIMEEQFQFAPFDDIRVSPGEMEIIISMLKDDDTSIRTGAAFTLGSIANSMRHRERPQVRSILLKEAVPVLMEMLESKEVILPPTPYIMEEWTVQMVAMITLKSIDPELFSEAEAVVKKMREGDDPQMRRIAAKTLAKIEKEREMARRAACISNLKQIGVALLYKYAAARDGRFPKCLSDLFPDYITSPSLFICPSADIGIPERITRDNVNLAYEYIPGLRKGLRGADSILVLYDRAGNHQGGRGALFLDGTVRWIPDEAWAATYQRHKELLRR